MKKLLIAAATTMIMLTSAAQAHDQVKSRHGGTVQSAGDLGFELVKEKDGAAIYVEDHGKPFATQGTTGKLTVLNGSEKTEADLVPTGDNKLEAKGVKLDSGARVVAAVTLPTKKVVTVRFTVK
jgi:hypothetical protein